VSAAWRWRLFAGFQVALPSAVGNFVMLIHTLMRGVLDEVRHVAVDGDIAAVYAPAAEPSAARVFRFACGCDEVPSARVGWHFIMSWFGLLTMV